MFSKTIQKFSWQILSLAIFCSFNLFSILEAQTVDEITGQSQISQNNDQAITPKKSNQPLTVEKIYGSDELTAKRFNIQWAESGHNYAKLVPSKEPCGGKDIVWEDPISGQSTVLVLASELIPSNNHQEDNSSKPIDIASYTFSDDLSRFLIYTNTRKVWRTHSRGDYWILEKESDSNGNSKRLFRKLGGSEAKEATLQFAKMSPNGKYVAYVRENNIYVEEIVSGKILPLTTDGDVNIINGTFDWVYEEEFGVQDGFRWSPDGNSIVFWRLDTTKEPIFTMIDNVSEFYPKTYSFKYPRAGYDNAVVDIGIVDIPETCFGENQPVPQVRFVLFDDSNEFYVPWLDWSKTAKGPVIQKMNRAQNQSDLLVVDLETMKTETILSETDPAWVSVHSPIWLDDNDRFLWISERNGYRRIYLVSISDPNHLNPVTPENIDIIDFVAFDYDFKENNNELTLNETGIYFYASPENPTERFLYRIDLDGQNCAKVSGLSSIDSGMHSWQLSADSEFAIHYWSTLGVPPTYELVKLNAAKAESINIFEDNSKLKQKLTTENLGKTGFMSFEIEDEETGNPFIIDGYFILPPNWNPDDLNQKFPLLVYVYGEPAGQTVQNSWGGTTYLFHQMLAARGCLVVSFDNRGTPVPKGRQWRKVIHKKIGAIGRQDQAAALRKVLNTSDFAKKIDSERIGVWGWSAGGTSTLNLLFNYPDLYKVGIAVAPVPDFRYYDTIYQERYTGLIDESIDSYINGSPYSFAQNLQGKLLLIHGTGDDNCHYQSFERLVDKLIKYGKSFDLMSYPYRSHGISEGEGTTLHLRNLMLRFWEENLLNVSNDIKP